MIYQRLKDPNVQSYQFGSIFGKGNAPGLAHFFFDTVFMGDFVSFSGSDMSDIKVATEWNLLGEWRNDVLSNRSNVRSVLILEN